MTADPDLIGSIVAVIGAVITVGGTIMSARITKKDKDERAADRRVQEETADKLEAEKEDIRIRTSGYVLQQVRDELTATKKDLQAAYREADRLRKLLAERNDTIERQDKKIRRLTRRAETLEEWIDGNMERFEQLGINGLPIDHSGDREHDEECEMNDGDQDR